MKLKNRYRVREKERKEIAEYFNHIFGKNIFTGTEIIDRADANGITVLIINNEVLGFFCNEKPFLTIRGLIKYKPDNRCITVDQGAVKAILNGADVMAAGVVAADKFQKNDFVWVKDELHNTPLAVGIAQMSSAEILGLKSGKAVKCVHRVGDKLWELL